MLYLESPQTKYVGKWPNDCAFFSGSFQKYNCTGSKLLWALLTYVLKIQCQKENRIMKVSKPFHCICKSVRNKTENEEKKTIRVDKQINEVCCEVPYQQSVNIWQMNSFDLMYRINEWPKCQIDELCFVWFHCVSHNLDAHSAPAQLLTDAWNSVHKIYNNHSSRTHN